MPEGDFNSYEYAESMNQLGMENQDLRNKTLQMAGAVSNQMFSDEDHQNLIQYQLETDRILERIEHYLKGDQIKFDNDGKSYFSDPTKKILALCKQDPKTKVKYYIQEFKEQKHGSEVTEQVLVKIVNPVKIKDEEGKEYNTEEAIDVRIEDSKIILEKIMNKTFNDIGYQYIEVTDDEKKPLNGYGVAELMRILSMYVTKETFLSYYDEERINEIMGDLGDKINDFLYCNYEKMGMDTKFKESKYCLIVLNILHTVESCYRRSIEGHEQENLRTRAIVTQNQNPGGSMYGGQGFRPPTKKKWSPLKPSTW